MNQTNAALLDEFCDTVWLEDGLAKNTLEAYRRDLRQFVEWLEGHGRDSIAAATDADLSDYLASRHARRSPAPRGIKASTQARLHSS